MSENEEGLALLVVLIVISACIFGLTKFSTNNATKHYICRTVNETIKDYDMCIEKDLFKDIIPSLIKRNLNGR